MITIFFVLLSILFGDLFADVCFKLTVINNSENTIRVENILGDKYSEAILNDQYSCNNKNNKIDIKNGEIVDISVTSLTPDKEPNSKDYLIFSSSEKQTKVIINPSFLRRDFISIEENNLDLIKEIRPCGVGYNLVIPGTSSQAEPPSIQSRGEYISLSQWLFCFYKKIVG